MLNLGQKIDYSFLPMKKKPIFSHLIRLFILLIVASCATESPIDHKDENSTQAYSASTQKEFEDIEKAEALTPSRISPLPIVQESTALVPVEKLSTKGQERLLEINQNLAYYCMKHRKDPAFSHEEQCLHFTQMVLAECKKQHQTLNVQMLTCIKSRLTKKR
ncbi:MAG: hypothetical protein KBD76_05770 [Bacteriovorax sp.]|nr:hypothetical protein [Bacteriovorax sp.]